MKDQDERDSEKEQTELRKKKKRFPFYAKVGGGLARHRADRKAFGGGVKKRQEGGGISSVRRKPVPGEKREPPPLTGPTEGLRRGGAVASKADAELIDPNEPNAPAGGAVRQKFQDGGNVPLPRRDPRGAVGRALSDPDVRERIGGIGRKRGGVLSAGERQAMPKSEFALPGKGKGPKGAGAGSYPIPDEGHAKSALSRGKQHASPGELATIKRKVKAKFPSMDVS
jgi:hypothetical protein